MTTNTTLPPARDGRGLALALTILGAVCSAVVTGVLAAQEVSTTEKLVGMAVGAALPPLVGAVGPGPRIRVAVAVLMTAVAVVLAYGGGQLFAKVSNTEPPLPTPDAIATSLPWQNHQDAGDQARSGNVLEERSGELGIRVEPGAITCQAKDGCGPVTVTSIGTAPLEITSLAFERDAASFLTATGCQGVALAEHEQCAVSLRFSADRAPESVSTHLIINQNLPGKPTLVPLEAHGLHQVEPNLALGQATCLRASLVRIPHTDTVSGPLVIDAPVTRSGPDLPTVKATVHVNGDLQWTFAVEPDQPSIHVSDDYEGPFPTEITVTIDSAGTVEESSEADNVTTC